MLHSFEQMDAYAKARAFIPGLPTLEDLYALTESHAELVTRVAELEAVADNTDGDCRCALRSAMLLHVSSVLCGNDTGLDSSDPRHTVVIEEARRAMARAARLESERNHSEKLRAREIMDFDRVSARVAELEAAARPRPMSEAPACRVLIEDADGYWAIGDPSSMPAGMVQRAVGWLPLPAARKWRASDVER